MNILRGETVLVTGAAGSIGSEICRQVLLAEPRNLVMLDHSENGLFETDMELRRSFPDAHIELALADIQDVERLETVFETFRPSAVYHAAAHKHVPMLEENPGEAIKNNAIGSFNVAFLSERYEAKRFVLISTDKAVHPTSVMGATKRLAEMIIGALGRTSETIFIAVRFGNVLGSRGSVVPIFRSQIAAGGPVTVTHPDAERYFMTIPEAVNLVLQAAALGENGQIFLLDMGEQMRIADLARRMIALSGFEPDVDIDIDFTSLRPGEKIKEELLATGEDLVPTLHPKIFATEIERPTLEEVKAWLRRLSLAADDPDPNRAIQALQEVIPDFQPADDVETPFTLDTDAPESPAPDQFAVEAPDHSSDAETDEGDPRAAPDDG